MSLISKPLFADVPARTKPVIFAFEGPELTARERDFFRQASPLGFILFDKKGTRNIQDPAQVRALTDSLKSCVGWDCPVLIDQEGGRVQRMKAPHWRAYPPAQMFGERALEDMEAALEALKFNSLQMADDLVDVGVNVNCTPVLDVLLPETHDVIGDRSFGTDPELVGRLGLEVCRHYLAAGVVPVIKHIPGHGRAEADSHLALPVVKATKRDLQEIDFKPFQILAASDIGSRVWAMTAHVVYEALDKAHPASTSASIVGDVIRREIGFDGFLLSDDLDMKALDAYGDIGGKAMACLDAGCDAVLHCSGDFKAMEVLAASVPVLSEEARKRLQSGAGVA